MRLAEVKRSVEALSYSSLHGYVTMAGLPDCREEDSKYDNTGIFNTALAVIFIGHYAVDRYGFVVVADSAHRWPGHRHDWRRQRQCHGRPVVSCGCRRSHGGASLFLSGMHYGNDKAARIFFAEQIISTCSLFADECL